MKLTINDIAKLANVSKATVSRVINQKSEGVGAATKQKILQIIAEHNYQPSLIARGLVTKRTNTLGLIIPDIVNPFFPQLARGVEDEARKLGYNLFLCNSDHDLEKETAYIQALIEKSVDGVILASNMSKSNVQCQMLKERAVPFILLDRYIEGMEQEQGVFVDNQEGAYRAVEHLLQQGHQRIAYISGPLEVATSWNRFQGFQKAYCDRGMEIDYQLVKEGDYQIESGMRAIAELLRDGQEFTAVFAGNDLMAIGAMKVLKQHQLKVPEQVEVIGFDNIELASLIDPALSTVAQPTYEMGVLGAQWLVARIEDRPLPEQHLYLKTELLLRDTTRLKD